LFPIPLLDNTGTSVFATPFAARVTIIPVSLLVRVPVAFSSIVVPRL